MSNKLAFTHSWKTVILIESADEKTKKKITQSSSKNFFLFHKLFITDTTYHEGITSLTSFLKENHGLTQVTAISHHDCTMIYTFRNEN